MDLIGEATHMSKASFLKQLASQLSSILPSQLGTLKKDFEKNCHSLLAKAFNQFDLVTREEFDAQSKVLLRTRKKIEALEANIKALEGRLKQKHRHSTND